MNRSADVIVVGLGAAGAATAYQLARRGAKVIGIDRFHPPHDRGSSHGESRITRQAIGEGDDYVPLALRAHDLWREIEAESGESLMLTTGALIIGRQESGAIHVGKPDFVRNTVGAARRFGIPHEVLSHVEARHRFPQFNPGDAETIYYEPGAGLLFPERCVAVQLALAGRYGARIRTGEAVLEVINEAAGARVVTDRGTYAADQLIVSAGPWAGGLLGDPYAKRLSTWRQTMHWFEPEEPAWFTADRFPVFIWMHGGRPEDWFYGFPRLPGETLVKIADERFDAPLTGPEAQTQAIDPGAAPAIWSRHIDGRINGVGARCRRSSACLYTMAPDSRFLIGRDPERDRVIVISACSGHGFKHSAAIGDLAAELATERTPPALLAPFSLRDGP